MKYPSMINNQLIPNNKQHTSKATEQHFYYCAPFQSNSKDFDTKKTLSPYSHLKMAPSTGLSRTLCKYNVDILCEMNTKTIKPGQKKTYWKVVHI